MRNFSVLWENHFSTKSRYNFLCNLFNPEIFWKRGPPRSFFGSETKKSREKVVISPPVVKIFDKRTFLKTKGIPYDVFRYCEKIKLRQNCDTTFNAIYLMQNFSEKKGPPRSFLCSARQRSFERKSWYPPPSHKNFR